MLRTEHQGDALLSVAVIDGGGANIGSVLHALQRLGVEATLTTETAVIRRADRVILPGVGAARPAMARLQEAGLVEVLRSLTQPVLGICLGMQLLCTHSGEGEVECLGIIDARVRRFDDAIRLPIPHRGWNQVSASPPVHRLWPGAASHGWAYFVHSFEVPVCPSTVARCTYGREFSAAIARDNFLGVQFHPERSSAFGQAVLRSFLSS